MLTLGKKNKIKMDLIFEDFPSSLKERVKKIFDGEDFESVRSQYVEDPNSFRWLYYAGLRSLEKQEYKISILFLQKSLEKNPNILFAVAGIGACKFYLGEFVDSLKQFHRAIQMLIYHEMNEYERLTGQEPHIRNTSIPVKGLLVYKDKIFVGDSRLSALDYFENNDLPEIDEEFSNLIMPDAIYHFGNYCRNKGLFEISIALFRLAVRLKPNEVIYQTNLGTCYAEKGDISTAIMELKKAIQIDPSDAIAYSGLGVCYNSISNKEEAIRNLQIAIDLRKGDYPFAQDKLLEIRHGIAPNKINNTMNKVFISYASEDKDFVLRLAKDLEKNGITIWLDDWEILPGDSIIEKIENALKEHTFFLPVLSSNFNVKAFPLKELRAAIMKQASNHSKYIIPVLKEKCEIPMLISDIAYANLSNDYDLGLKKIILSINK